MIERRKVAKLTSFLYVFHFALNKDKDIKRRAFFYE